VEKTLFLFVVNDSSVKSSLKSIIELIESAAKVANYKGFQQLDLHLSLSKHLPLKIFQIELFLKQVGAIVKEFSPFSLTLEGLTKYTNESGTKHFISIDVNHGSQTVSLISLY
jgi:hypothetical protein